MAYRENSRLLPGETLLQITQQRDAVTRRNSRGRSRAAAKSLNWFLNSKQLAAGSIAGTTNLRLGTDTVTLLATDGIGRSNKAVQTIEVFAGGKG